MKPYNTHQTKKDEIREMFNNIAPAYDRLNHTLSFNIDRIWRRRVVNHVKRLTPHSILDLATGTGDLAIQMATRIDQSSITAVDLSQGMLEVAKQKVASRNLNQRISLHVGDAEHLDIESGSMDVVTVAFGVRNFGDLNAGLVEIARTIRPGGEVVILEFSTPQNPIFGAIYKFYSRYILPVIGGMISKDRGAYEYLPASVEEFPQPAQFMEIMKRAGFKNCRARSQSLGIAQIYIGEK